MGIQADAMVGAANLANGSSNGAPSSTAAKFDLAPHFIGGSHLGAAQPGKVKDFVADNDGHTVITKVRDPIPGSGVPTSHGRRRVLI